jgi:hypothetical protein
MFCVPPSVSAGTTALALMLTLGLSLGSLAAVDQAALDQPSTDRAWAITPMGWLPTAQVHRLAPGQGVDVEDDHIDVLDQAGTLAARHQLAADQVSPRPGTGWIASTVWSNTTGHPLTSFQSTWTVPPPPSAWDGQTIFLFPGIVNATNHILQPVLQFGSSTAGGGAYWSIASWYVSGTGAAFYTGLTPVAPGTPLVGIMALAGHTAKGFSYVSYFAGVGASVLPVSNIPQLTVCYEALEAYGLKQRADYPATNETVFSNINLVTTTGYPPLRWTPQDWVTGYGQHAVVISNSPVNGAVALFY